MGAQEMRTGKSMKSVIAQGSTVARAIEEALKKAGMPQEFFIKLLEDAQSGFLGFGSKKAKIALFYKQESTAKLDGLLQQKSYEELFDNQEIGKQIEQQLKNINMPKSLPTNHPKQHSQSNQMQQRSMPTQEKSNMSHVKKVSQSISPRQNVQTKPIQSIDQKQTLPEKESGRQQSDRNFYPKKRSQFRHEANVSQQQHQAKDKSVNKLVLRQLPKKNNDSSK